MRRVRVSRETQFSYIFNPINSRNAISFCFITSPKFILSACVPGLNGNLFSDADATGDPNAPASIQIDGPLRAVATYCNGPFTVTLKKSSGETAVVPSSLSLSLSVSSGGIGLFFSDSECAKVTSSLEIAGGESKASFYFKGNIAQGLSLVAAAARLKTVAFEYTVTANDYTIAIASGDAQSGTVGTAVSNQLVAVVKDSMGKVVPDVTVDWAVVADRTGDFLQLRCNISHQLAHHFCLHTCRWVHRILRRHWLLLRDDNRQFKSHGLRDLELRPNRRLRRQFELRPGFQDHGLGCNG